MTDLTHAEVMAYERRRYDELCATARLMTLLGLEGEDPHDPTTRLLLDTGEAATSTFEELVAWIRLRAPRR